MKKLSFKRIGSFVMALVMVLSLLPVLPHTHVDAAAVVTWTNKDGQATNTFTVGDPVYMEIAGLSSENWVDLWYVKPGGGYESNYRLWWYVPEGKVNLWDGVWEEGAGFWNGMNMPAGNYELYLEGNTLLSTITLVEPDAQAAAEKSLEVVQDGSKVSITAVNYSEYSHVSVLNESGAEMYKFFCIGNNGAAKEYDLIPGTYTIAMYNDWDKAVLQERKQITVEGEEVALLTTDKTEYKFGEPIMVTAQLGNPNWLGLYKQDDTNIVNGGTTSMFWLYPTVGEPVNLLSGEQQRHDEFVAGTYKVLLLDANYGVVAAVENIVITTEIDESKTVTVDPTCTENGTITYTYTDGTKKVVTYPEVESLKALGHDYETLRPQFNEEDLQHTIICNNNNAHTITENCDWDEGIVTDPATEEKEGTKEFTCKVCGGHRYEAISVKQVDYEDITNPATCESAGTKVVYYTDGSSKEVEIPKLNHAYPDTFTYNNDKATHSKVCGNDAAHVITEDCSFVGSAITGGTCYTCSECGGSYDLPDLVTDKTTYKYGEPILVSVNKYGDDWDWVGIYKKGESYNPDAGGSYSIFWYYVYDAGMGTSNVNILTTRNENGRSGEFIAGEYTIVYFPYGGYAPAATVDIVVTTEIDESKTATVDPTCTEHGTITYTYTDGTQKVVTYPEVESLKAIGHAYPDTWTPVAGTETHSRVCANNAEHVETKNCTWDEGVEILPPTYDTKGEMKHTCTVCQNTKIEDIPVLSATETGRQVFAPTCTDEGYTLVTYSDGSTKKVDYKPALEHDFSGDYIHINGTHTHKKECQRENCDEQMVENCTLETNGVPNGDGYQYACTLCGEWTELIIITDKTVYASGEDIIVTIHPNYAANMNNKDWIGLYHKGETPNQEMNPTSIRWDYAVEFREGKNIFTTNWHDRPAEDPDNFLKAGQYTLYLCANDGYTVVTKVYITVTAQEDPSKTVKVEPTCDKDGKITYYNTDGTISRVVTAAEDESLKAHGHTYGTWTYNGVEKQSHTHTCICDVCEEPCGFDETFACEWDNGVETKPATKDETGIMTYTCTVCQGTKEETLPKLDVTVTGTEVDPATCDDPGNIRTFYSDGTWSDKVIPAKGHDYSDWTMVPGENRHQKVCANDPAHILSESCTITSEVSGKQVTHSCSVCEGSYVSGLVITDKKVYEITDPIYVTAYGTYSGAWVGLYKEGEMFDPNNGGVASMFWIYVKNDMVGNAFDITAVTSIDNVSGHRGEKLGNGKYVLVFFGDSGYTNVIDTVEIEIFSDISNTKFDLLFDGGEVRENGYHQRYEFAAVRNPAAGDKKVSLGVNITAGEAGSSWVGVFEGYYNLDTDYTGMNAIVEKYIADIDGNTPFSLNWPIKGGFDFYVGYFTIVIFADASTNYPVQYVTFEVYRPTVSETVRKNATCEVPGIKWVVYVDDNDPNTADEGLEIIPALGHAYGDQWLYNEGEKTHSKICANDPAHMITEECSFDTCELTKIPTATTEGIETYICSICDGTYTEAIPMVSYEGGKRVAGNDRYQTSIQIAEALKEANGTGMFDAIVVASGMNFADALSGNYLANKKNAPILLIRNTAEELAMVKDYIRENLNVGGTIYLLGGTGVVPGAMEIGMDEFNVKRLAGKDRYETNLLILKEAGVAPGEDILICTGKNFADGMSASALNKPVMLVRDTLSDDQTDFLRSVNGSKIYIIGGNMAVNDRVEAVLGLYGQTVRIGGESRYETSVNLAKTFFANVNNVVLANGANFPDGLCGGTLANSMNAPIILVANNRYSTAAEYVAANGVVGGIALGGSGCVNNTVMQNIFG